jgi:osmotically-inducible protein OsmY
MNTLFSTRGIAVSLLALAVTALSVSPAAADGPKHALFERVQEQVLRYSFFTVFDNINVEIADEGHVVLTGHVTAEHKAKTIGERVDAVDGVTLVTNEIAVLPVSQFDDRLRRVIARAIYGNPNFWHYATTSNPSIHIVVNRGHVTLTGVVDSETDRQLARALAGQFSAFSVTNELRLPHEVTAELEALG